MLKMSPEEREKNLSKLPPAQQTRLRNQLNNLDRMTPAQRARNVWIKISRLEKLPPERRQAVTKQVQSMNGLSVADQREFLHSSEFARNYSPDEQQIVRERFPAAASDAVKPTDKLIPERRQAVNQERQRIQGMSFEERKQALNSPEFGQKFSPEEQQILRDNFPNAAK